MALDPILADLPSLGRAIAKASDNLGRARAMTVDEARAFDPFAPVRHVAGKTTYATIHAWDAPAHEAMTRSALLRWVHELLQARVGYELWCDDREAAHAVDPRLDPNIATTIARSYADAWTRLLEEPNPARAFEHLERAAELAAPVAAVRRERRARRFEAARRLELAHPLALSIPLSVEALAQHARALLDATEPLAKDAIRDVKKSVEGPLRPTHVMRAGFADAAADRWPAKLLARSLHGVFGALSRREFAVPNLPRPLAPASFLRGAATYGYALRLSGVPRSLPFVLARDPAPASAHLFGGALAVAMASEPFQRRALDLGARAASTQSRHLRLSLFLALRGLAARFLLDASEHVDREVFAELGARLYGVPLPDGLRDAWPEPLVDTAARFLASLHVQAFVDGLVARFDEDWYRNPHAGRHLGSLAAAPAWELPDPELPDDVVKRIARALEESLG